MRRPRQELAVTPEEKNSFLWPITLMNTSILLSFMICYNIQTYMLDILAQCSLYWHIYLLLGGTICLILSFVFCLFKEAIFIMYDLFSILHFK
jgi:hypothetical protein